VTWGIALLFVGGGLLMHVGFPAMGAAGIAWGVVLLHEGYRRNP
jgi:hypothetical protein